MKAQRLRRKLADKSARIRLKSEQHNEDAAMAAFRLQDLQQELHQIESRNNEKQEAGCVEDESYEQVVAGNPIENVSHQFFGELSEAFGEASQAHHIRDSFPGPNFSPSQLEHITDSSSPGCSPMRVRHTSDSSSPQSSPTKMEQANLASTKKGGQGGNASSLKSLARWAFKTFAPTGVIDTGATGHFTQTGVGIPTGRPSTKHKGSWYAKWANRKSDTASAATH